MPRVQCESCIRHRESMRKYFQRNRERLLTRAKERYHRRRREQQIQYNTEPSRAVVFHSIGAEITSS